MERADCYSYFASSFLRVYILYIYFAFGSLGTNKIVMPRGIGCRMGVEDLAGPGEGWCMGWGVGDGGLILDFVFFWNYSFSTSRVTELRQMSKTRESHMISIFRFFVSRLFLFSCYILLPCAVIFKFKNCN